MNVACSKILEASMALHGSFHEGMTKLRKAPHPGNRGERACTGSSATFSAPRKIRAGEAIRRPESSPRISRVKISTLGQSKQPSKQIRP
jgi:hypothetical protein